MQLPEKIFSGPPSEELVRPVMLGVCSTSPRPWKGLEKVRDPFAFSRRRENGGGFGGGGGREKQSSPSAKKKKNVLPRACVAAAQSVADVAPSCRPLTHLVEERDRVNLGPRRRGPDGRDVLVPVPCPRRGGEECPVSRPGPAATGHVRLWAAGRGDPAGDHLRDRVYPRPRDWSTSSTSTINLVTGACA